MKFVVAGTYAEYIQHIQWNKESKCKHDGGYNETQACDAICRQCGKNLGFIGKLRNK